MCRDGAEIMETIGNLPEQKCKMDIEMDGTIWDLGL